LDVPYCDEDYMRLEGDTPSRYLARPILGLFQGQPGARRWRQALSTAHSGLQDGPQHFATP
ncbi:MAG: hypothetical protein ACHBMF_08450, partial [Chromatiales bacterium]